YGALLVLVSSLFLSLVVLYLFITFFFLMIRRPPRYQPGGSSAASVVYKRQVITLIETWVVYELYNAREYAKKINEK
ncbi:hypothetical protein CBG19_10175, partial [Limosilactobacillus reuteri]